MSRDYPALDLRWPVAPAEDHLDRLLAAIDEEAPTAVEEREHGVRVFFGTPAARAHAASRLVAADAALTCIAVDVPDEDWAARSQASLGPVRVGNIVVSPPAAGNDAGGRFPEPDAKTTPGVVSIVIAPSMGFGTGHHASTRVCLALLQRTSVSGARVLDIGTGSGVLALAARALGAREIVAADYDPDALTAARENLERNDATGAIHVTPADLANLNDAGPLLDGPFDLVLANLTGGVLVRYAAALARLVSPGGRIIASGFQDDEVRDVREAMSAAGLCLRERLDEQDWVGGIFAR